MSNPQITGRTRLGPTEALRAVFSGIGRILMAADRSQDQAASAAGQQAAGQSAGRQSPGQKAETSGRNGRAASRDRRSAKAAPVQASRWRSLDQTGNVRLLTAEDIGDDDAAPATPATFAAKGAAATETERAAAKPAASHGPAAEGAPEANGTPAAARTESPESPALPLASYDTLTLASIRARLRTLDVAQLRVLVDYEAAHAERPDVLGMLERRIEKLQNGG